MAEDGQHQGASRGPQGVFDALHTMHIVALLNKMFADMELASRTDQPLFAWRQFVNIDFKFDAQRKVCLATFVDSGDTIEFSGSGTQRSVALVEFMDKFHSLVLPAVTTGVAAIDAQALGSVSPKTVQEVTRLYTASDANPKPNAFRKVVATVFALDPPETLPDLSPKPQEASDEQKRKFAIEYLNSLGSDGSDVDCAARLETLVAKVEPESLKRSRVVQTYHLEDLISKLTGVQRSSQHGDDPHPTYLQVVEHINTLVNQLSCANSPEDGQHGWVQGLAARLFWLTGIGPATNGLVQLTDQVCQSMESRSSKDVSVRMQQEPFSSIPEYCSAQLTRIGVGSAQEATTIQDLALRLSQITPATLTFTTGYLKERFEAEIAKLGEAADLEQLRENFHRTVAGNRPSLPWFEALRKSVEALTSQPLGPNDRIVPRLETVQQHVQDLSEQAKRAESDRDLLEQHVNDNYAQGLVALRSLFGELVAAEMPNPGDLRADELVTLFWQEAQGEQIRTELRDIHRMSQLAVTNTEKDVLDEMTRMFDDTIQLKRNELAELDRQLQQTRAGLEAGTTEAALLEELQTCRSGSETLATANITLEAQCREQSDKLRECEEQKNQQYDTYQGELERINQAHTETVEELKSTHEKTLQVLQNNNRALDERVRQQEQTIAAGLAHEEQLKESLAKETERSGALAERLEAIHVVLGQLVGEKSNADQQVKALSSQVADGDEKVRSEMARVNVLRGRMDQLHDEVAMANDQRDRMKAERDWLQRELTQLNTKLSSTQADFRHMKERLTGFYKQVTPNKIPSDEEVNAVIAKFKQDAKRLEDLESDVKAMNGWVGDAVDPRANAPQPMPQLKSSAGLGEVVSKVSAAGNTIRALTTTAAQHNDSLNKLTEINQHIHDQLSPIINPQNTPGATPQQLVSTIALWFQDCKKSHSEWREKVASALGLTSPVQHDDTIFERASSLHRLEQEVKTAKQWFEGSGRSRVVPQGETPQIVFESEDVNVLFQKGKLNGNLIMDIASVHRQLESNFYMQQINNFEPPIPLHNFVTTQNSLLDGVVSSANKLVSLIAFICNTIDKQLDRMCGIIDAQQRLRTCPNISDLLNLMVVVSSEYPAMFATFESMLGEHNESPWEALFPTPQANMNNQRAIDENIVKTSTMNKDYYEDYNRLAWNSQRLTKRAAQIQGFLQSILSLKGKGLFHALEAIKSLRDSPDDLSCKLSCMTMFTNLPSPLPGVQPDVYNNPQLEHPTNKPSNKRARVQQQRQQQRPEQRQAMDTS